MSSGPQDDHAGAMNEFGSMDVRINPRVARPPGPLSLKKIVSVWPSAAESRDHARARLAVGTCWKWSPHSYHAGSAAATRRGSSVAYRSWVTAHAPMFNCKATAH